MILKMKKGGPKRCACAYTFSLMKIRYEATGWGACMDCRWTPFYLPKHLWWDRFKMSYDFKLEPFDHQYKTLLKCWDKEYFALFMDMGTGKTKVLLDNAGILYEKGKINGLFVIAPKRNTCSLNVGS